MKNCETCDYYDVDSRLCALDQTEMDPESKCSKYSGYDIYDDIDDYEDEDELDEDLEDDYPDIDNKSEGIFEDL